jgi:hypothetical protein
MHLDDDAVDDKNDPTMECCCSRGAFLMEKQDHEEECRDGNSAGDRIHHQLFHLDWWCREQGHICLSFVLVGLNKEQYY